MKNRNVCVFRNDTDTNIMIQVYILSPSLFTVQSVRPLNCYQIQPKTSSTPVQWYLSMSEVISQTLKLAHPTAHTYRYKGSRCQGLFSPNLGSQIDICSIFALLAFLLGILHQSDVLRPLLCLAFLYTNWRLEWISLHQC